uniref:Uncharacterized protein n=1 Tax=viral metagenome TaxID=1070528 RepID=A0A6H1Z8V3_9ZZZZ
MKSERKAGRIYIGEGDQRKSFPDPVDPGLQEAMHRMRYEPARGTLRREDRYLVLAAAEAYQHLTTYPLGAGQDHGSRGATMTCADRCVADKVTCPRCRRAAIEIHEAWACDLPFRQAQDGTVERVWVGDPDLHPTGEVDATCETCGHRWRLRRHWSPPDDAGCDLPAPDRPAQ